jgi:tetratricopeptide (TPR) repeat protein
MAKGHEMLALCCHSLGDWQEGHAHERQRQQLAAGSLDVDQAFDVHLCLWEYHLYGPMGPGGIRPSVEQTLEQAQRMQAPRALGLCKSFSGALDFQAGRWVEAEAQLREAVQLFRQVGSASGEALSLQRLGVLLTARGQLEPARAALDEGIVVGGRAAMRSHCLTRLHASLARNRLAAGDRAAALLSLQEGLAEVARHGHCSTCNALLLPEAVRVELAFEHLGAAEQHAAQLERVAERFGSRAWTAMARCGRGRVLAARGEHRAALQALQAAGRDFAELGHPYEAARVLLVQSRVLAALAQPEQAAAELAAQAQSALEALGATALEA